MSTRNSITPHSSGRLRRRYHGRTTTNTGYLAGASGFTLNNPVMYDVNLVNHDNERVAMESLKKYTIPGAHFNSSDRFPPPQCHPGTRKSIVERIQRWLSDTARQRRILWLSGSAGAGKSAIMQTLAESVVDSPNLSLGATLFFSRPNRRNDPSKVFITVAYQIAIKYPSYRDYFLQAMAANPQLPEKAMRTQFERLIFKPFAEQNILQGHGTLLILLDGLDECHGKNEQCEIIGLVSYISLAYPDTPLIWAIASRPESYLKAIFSRRSILPSYEKEEVPIDSDEACKDVECYLRDDLERIRRGDLVARLLPHWPEERQFLTIAAAATGLFAYASFAIRFIDDPVYGNPVSRLKQLLDVIDSVPIQPRGTHPLARLDELYTYILSQIPQEILPSTRRILGRHVYIDEDSTLVYSCNWLGLTPNDAYGALHCLHSVLGIPPPEDASEEDLYFHHQSFSEYLRDPGRSGGFHISESDFIEQQLECSVRILKDVYSRNIPSTMTPADVALSWPLSALTDKEEALREDLYYEAGSTFLTEWDRHLAVPIPKLQDVDVTRIMKTLNFFDKRHYWDDITDMVSFMIDIQGFPDSRIHAELIKRRLIGEIPIGEFSLDNIRQDLPIILRYGNQFYKTFPVLEGPFGGVKVLCATTQMVWSTEDDNAGETMQQVYRDINTARQLFPDIPVLIFGNDVVRCIICHFRRPGESPYWTYIIPCRPSLVLHGTQAVLLATGNY